MIVKMQKVYIAVRTQDEVSLHEALRDLAVLHLTPVDPAKAVPEEKILKAIDELERARQILGAFAPQGARPDIPVERAAAEAIRLHREAVEISSRLNTIHQRMEQLSLWGEVRLDQLKELQNRGLVIDFYTLPQEKLPEIQADCVHVLRHYPGHRVLAAVANRGPSVTLPKEAEKLDWPHEDRPKLRSVAKRLDDTLKHNNQRLAELAHRVHDMASHLIELHNQAEFTAAKRSALKGDSLSAVQGWVPLPQSKTLRQDLAARGIVAAVLEQEPDPQDDPPTLIEYLKWAKPIKGLFDILGTLPGYRELDLSPFFMISFPIFAAMLIGDACYGLVLLVPPLLFYRKLSAKVGAVGTQLLMVMGAVALVWGVLSGSYFGLTPESMAIAGGYVQSSGTEKVPDIAAMQKATGGWAFAGNAIIATAPLWNADSEKARELLIKISFLFGCIHLTLAHLFRGVSMLPDLRALAEFGWCIFLWAMLGIIWLLFFGAAQLPVPVSAATSGLLVGGVMVILFSAPNPNPIKRIGGGIASNLLPALGTFGDTLSYIRLMAVGLASYYIASAFNGLASTLAESATWFAAVPVLLFGHALNMGLAVIAIFAHGVRLNMLEFSNNAGVQWAGHAYDPFRKKY